MKKLFILLFSVIFWIQYAFATNIEILPKEIFVDETIKNNPNKSSTATKDPSCTWKCLVKQSNKLINDSAFSYSEVCNSKDYRNLLIEFDYANYEIAMYSNTPIYKYGSKLYYAKFWILDYSSIDNKLYDIYEYDCDKKESKSFWSITWSIEFIQISANVNNIYLVVQKSDYTKSMTWASISNTHILEINKLTSSKKDYTIIDFPYYPIIIDNIWKNSFANMKSDFNWVFKVFVEFLKYSLKNDWSEHLKQIKERKTRNLYNPRDYLYNTLSTNLLGNKVSLEEINNEWIWKLIFTFPVWNPIDPKSFKLYTLKTTIDLKNMKIGY